MKLGEDVASDHRERIVQDPLIVGGEAVIRGTRVTVRTILASLAEGAPVEGILRDFPTLAADDVHAAIAFGAASARELVVRGEQEIAAGAGHDLEDVLAEADALADIHAPRPGSPPPSPIE